LAIDNIWAYINQPRLNPQVHISENAYIFDIKLFNKETIREAVLNAIAHRSMIVQNDVVIKQSPTELTITNAGGFPIGVDKSNVLTVNSTPRSKRLAEVLQKTGLVEKSGQGVDKMFTNCIMEAKPLPDFSATDNYQVSLTFRTEIRNVPFLVYIRQEQAKRPPHHKLNVFQLMAIYNVCFGDGLEVRDSVIAELVNDEILLRSKIGKISMSKEYQRIYSEIHSTKSVNWISALKACAARYDGIITRKTYMEFLPDWVSVDKVRYSLSKLESLKVLKREGTGKGTKYYIVSIPENIDL
jgi:ATP-dependent DNA helicase RecG